MWRDRVRVHSSQIFWAASAAILLVLGHSPGATAADAERGFVTKTLRDAQGSSKYVVFVPENYTPEKEWPVILFLHGAGERGTDGAGPTTVGLGPLVKARAKTFPFLVVFPQCDDVKGRILTAWHPDSPCTKRALSMLDEVEKEYRVDKKRKILTGWSMGGYGAWELAAATPERWAAVVPVAGGGNGALAKNLKDVPIWAFHGGRDSVVPPQESRKIVAAVRAAGGDPRYTELPEAGHDVWKAVYDTDELYAWMLRPEFGSTGERPLSTRPGARALAQPDLQEPFVPAVEIPGAAYLRLGNQAWDALSYSIPQRIPADLLTGRLADIQDGTTVEGRYFNIQFSGISYAGQIVRAQVKAYQKDRLNIQLGVQNAVVSIGASYVTGRDHSAVAGPMSIVVGHRRPVWLNIDVTPYVENRRLRLKLAGSRFDIPNDNWYVTAPAGVSTQGFGMTRERVSSGLVSGVYGRKQRIEQQVLSVVPELLAKLEQNLDLPDSTRLIESFWPLPVYRPRIRLWPEGVSTDANGVSLSFGMTVAAIDPRTAPKSPRVLAPLGPSAADLPQGTNLQVGLAANILEPLTGLLIKEDVARIHVLDIPGEHFSQFADRQVLADAIPDLKRLGNDAEIWAELVLAGPLSVASARSPRDASVRRRTDFQSVRLADGTRSVPATEEPAPAMLFHTPKVVLSISVKEDPQQTQWTPYAEFAFEVAQQARSAVLRPGYEARALRLDWVGRPDVKATARFADGYKPQDANLNTDAAQMMFERGWLGWTQKSAIAEVAVPDVDFGLSKLRLEDAAWSPPHTAVSFAVAQTKIANSSDIPLVYDVKGPYSDWGGPYTLPPGDSHEFPAPYPLLFRRQTAGRYEMFTLSPGTHSEFRPPTGGGPSQLFQARE